MPLHDDTVAARSSAFEEELARQSLGGERRRAGFLVFLMGLWLFILFVRMLFPDPEGDNISRTFWTLATGLNTMVGAVAAYELAIRWLAGRCLVENRPFPSWIPYFSAAIETSLPSIAMLIFSTRLDPFQVLQVSIPFTYFIAIGSTILGLNYRVCLFSGLLAASSYFSLYLFWAHSTAPSSPLAQQLPIHAVKAAIILSAGVCASFIAAQLKRQFVAAIRAGEEARIALESEVRAREATRAKSAFLANMSHELRTPLNAVLGYAQLMARDRGRSRSDLEALSAIQRSGEHLLGLINDVLSISKIEAGRLTLTEAPFDPRDMIRAVETTVRPRARTKGLDLVVDCAPDLPETVRGDEGKVRQILVNLLGNAVKFTERGSVSLRARWSDATAHFEVEDTGYGIAAAELDRLFEAFAQTESGQRSGEGTGLGLAISCEIARRMGGDITVESEPGRGTIFTVEIHLPADATPRERPVSRTAIGLEPGVVPPRILVVDDGLDNRTLLVTLLRSVGLEVREATNGAEAVALWEEWRPSLIWMDMRMPVLDGRQATQQIRALERDGHCAIIALTASAFEHERTAIIDAGSDDFLTKPFREAAIFEMIERHLGVRFVYEESEQSHATPGGEEALTVTRLAALPAPLLDELHESLRIGDFDAVLELVGRIAERDEPLASEIERFARTYNPDPILALLEELRRRGSGAAATGS